MRLENQDASTNQEGIGLGLMICKNLVEQNGGKISAHSEGINKGSTFAFSMQMDMISTSEALNQGLSVMKDIQAILKNTKPDKKDTHDRKHR